ncbi:MAG TPA: isoprenylcysteine carboxylmethyltransferase family protein [Terriglobales bacterium]|nr:isoprenylcysteine carboxylmethyltransferase family protein [Terriglobales bacterium]
MDRGTILRVWLPLLAGLYAIYVTFASARVPHDAIRWLGLALCLIGLSGVIASRANLGRSFSVMAKATDLVTTGIYSRIRNPIYISSVTLIIGLILIVRRPVIALVLVVIIPMQIIRARREAAVLEAKFGDAYREYRKHTWF